MNKSTVPIITICGFLCASIAYSADVQFRIISDKSVCYKDEEVNCAFQLESNDFTESIKNIDFRIEDEYSKTFSYSFKLKPTKLGDFIIGPYELKIKNIVLKSNILRIKVVEQPQIAETILTSGLNNVVLYQNLKLEIESEEQNIINIRLAKKDNYDLIKIETTTKTDIINGKTTNKYSIRFILRVIKIGEFNISKIDFSNFDDDFNFEKITVIVK
jgi:hypothetical protein